MTILTMLGTGNYERSTYQWGERSFETALFPEALAEWFPGSDVCILATSGARRKHGETMLAAVPSARFIDIPDGATEEELWRMFQIISEAVPEGSAVLLDITHGFRSLFSLALLALAFLRVAKDIDLCGVVYGNYEARNRETNTSPVFDITPLVALLDGAIATDRFLKTGDARPLSVALGRPGVRSAASITKHLALLSEGLLAGRVGEVQNEADKLLTSLHSALESGAFAGAKGPYKLLERRLSDTYGPLRSGPSGGPDGELLAMLRFIEWYAENGHLLHASALAREWCVSLRCWKIGDDFHIAEKRRQHEDWIGAAVKLSRSNDVTISAEWVELVRQADWVQGLRNDLAHFKDERKSKTIRAAVAALPERLRRLGAALGLAGCQPAADVGAADALVCADADHKRLDFTREVRGDG